MLLGKYIEEEKVIIIDIPGETNKQEATNVQHKLLNAKRILKK
jgi:hypothetical protein